MDSINHEDIIEFWQQAGHAKWYEKDDAFDAEIIKKFARVHEAAKMDAHDEWQDTARGAMALLILLDQMARNIHRNTPQAFGADDKALGIARNAVKRGFDLKTDGIMRQWFYMPFMHSENILDQQLCCELTRKAGLDVTYEYAVDHADIIKQFGRFPHRNAILGRTSTPDELAFLAQGGFSG
jgi:uncharacterized protein (DUF924 family)